MLLHRGHNWILLAALASILFTGRASAEPICELDPPSIDFGRTALGESVERSLTVRNIGDGLLLGSLEESCPDFEIAEPVPIFVLFAGDSATFTIRYTANSPGPVECTLGTTSPRCGEVPLTGYGESLPFCVVEPTELDFGIVTVGQASDRTVTLTNEGEGTLSGALRFADDCDSFLLVDDDPTYALGPGERKEFTLRFVPAGSGPVDCTLETGSELCPDVNLNGTGELPPVCALDPSTLAFGTVTVGTFRDRTFKITNVGEGVLAGSVALTAGCAGFTFLDSDLSYSLPAAASKTFTVRFAPVTSGPFTCTIDTGAAECGDVAASGQGELPPACEVEPPELDFGTIVTGQSKDLLFEITNTGEGLLTGTITLGPACSAFTFVGSGPGYSLGPGETEGFTIRFAPPDSGSHSCVLQTGSGLCADLPLRGVGDSPALCVVDPPSLAFGDVLVGQGANRTFSIRNDGGSVLSGAVSEDCEDFELLDTPFYSLTAGQSRTFTLRFAPDGDGEQDCDVDLGSDECPTYEVTGTGVLLPSCQVEPRDLDFEIVPVGETRDLQFSITNDGGGRIQGVFTPSCDEFTIVGTTGYDLGPFASQFFTVRYRPTGEGTDACEIALGGQCGDVGVQGTGQLDPLCTVEPLSLDFGSVGVGAETTRSFTIRNDGGEVIQGAVSIPCAEFTLIGDPRYSLTAGQSREFSVQFRPAEEGISACEIGTGSLLCANVSASGIGVGVPTCSVEPSSLSFGEIKIGERRTLPFVIRNDGQGVLEGTVAPTCGVFAVLGTASYTLSQGEFQSFDIEFAPDSVGDFACSLSVGHDDCPQLPLEGTALPLESGCEVIPTTLQFGAVTIGESSDLPFTVRNSGETTLQGEVVPDCPDFDIIGAAEYEIAPLDSATFVIRFTPAAIGSTSCVIDLGSDACVSVAAEGSGVDAGGCVLIPSLVAFGDVPVGFHRELPLVLENRGGTTIEGALALEGPCPGFVLVGSSAYRVGPGEQVSFILRFEPSSVGIANCMISSPCGEAGLTGNGVLPAICNVTPEFVDFGNVIAGESAEREIVIANDGGGRIQGTLTSDCGAFQVLGDGAFDLDGGEQDSFQVRFAPVGIGPDACTLSTGTTECAGPIFVGFAVAVPEPDCAIEPASLQFGTVEVGRMETRSLVLRNLGPGRLTGSLTVDCDQVTVDGDASFDLGQDDSKTFLVRYAPTRTGALLCTMQAADCAPVEVVGNGAPPPDPSCGIFPSSVDFGPVVVGETSVRSISISNSGGGVISGTLRIDGATEFSLLTNPAIELEGGETADYEIEFAPIAGGNVQAILRVESDAEVCAAVPVNGRGASSPGAVCRISPAEIDFGSVAINETRSIDMVVKNEGTGVLAGAVALDCETFSVIGDPRFVVGPGEERTFEVVFQPAGEGHDACAIDFGTPGCAVDAMGRGVLSGEPECVIEPAQINFGSAEVGSRIERIVRVRNIGGGRLEGIPSADCGAFLVIDAERLSLASGESAELRVEFRPSLPQLFTCQVSLGDACVSVLSGSGVTNGPSLPVSTRLDLIGLAVQPSSPSVHDVFGALGTPGRDFDLLTWSDSDSTYASASGSEIGAKGAMPGSISSVESGIGYWIRASRNRSVTLSGTPVPSEPFVVPLSGSGERPGSWMLLANPFQFPVTISQFFVAGANDLATRIPLVSSENDLSDPVLWGWNGESYYRILSLAPGEGFWIHERSPEAASLVIDPNPFVEAEGTPLPLPEWTIAVFARQGSMRSSTIEIGAADVAPEEWNALDLAAPPEPPEGTLALALLHPEWEARTGRYQSEFQPERGTMIWDLVVDRLDPAQPLELELASEDLPAGVSLHITYWDGRQRTLARAPGTVTFEPMSGSVALRFVARFAPPDVIPPESELPGLVRDVPVGVPNPFGAATEVHFVSETGGPVVVTIFDAHGRKVRVLRTTGSAGETTVTWDGLDDLRNAVATGVYLVKIDDGARVQTLRLLRVR